MQLKMKGAKPHSRFQLEKCNLMCLMAGEWIDSKVTFSINDGNYVVCTQQIITSYIDLLQDSKLNVVDCTCIHFNKFIMLFYRDRKFSALIQPFCQYKKPKVIMQCGGIAR